MTGRAALLYCPRFEREKEGAELSGEAIEDAYSIEWFAEGDRNSAIQAGGALVGGLLSFFLLPGPVAVGLCVLAFVVVTFVTPYVTLLTLVAALPLHFLFRKPLGPVDLSLPDCVLLAAVLGLLALAYWRALVSGTDWLLLSIRKAIASPYFWPASLLIVMATLSVALLTPRTNRGLVVGLRAYSLLTEPVAVYALVLMTLRDRRRLWLALDVLLASAAVVAVAAFVEALRYTIAPPPVVGGYHRVQSLFNHPNTLGLYISRTLPLFGALAIALPGSLLRKRIYLGCSILLGIAALLGGSRAGWIALAAAAVLVAALARRFRWLIPAAGAGVAGLVLLVLSGQNRLSSLFSTGRGSADTRERLWKAAFEEIRKSPIWGTGLGDVRWMRRYIPERRLKGTELVDAHNLFLDFWSKLGIVGVVAIVWLLVGFYMLAWRAYRGSDGSTRALAIALMVAMAASLIHGMLDAFYFGLPFAILFWLFLGLAELIAVDAP